MTRLSTIRAANAALKAERRSGVVAIFVGATSGIGLHTLETTVTLFDDPTIYVLGRSEAKFSVHRAKLEQLNPKAKIIFLQVDVSLVADVDSACDRIAAAETKVDYLYMSAGMIPLNGPQYTREGLDICFALSYYTRIRFVQKLVPLLRKAPSPACSAFLPPVAKRKWSRMTSAWRTRRTMRHGPP
jgi:NAD(P)-dependent dehydrogenase (short-subunit alcohol dehydrogenase family)